jgi:hypothetical protein
MIVVGMRSAEDCYRKVRRYSAGVMPMARRNARLHAAHGRARSQPSLLVLPAQSEHTYLPGICLGLDCPDWPDLAAMFRLPIILWSMAAQHFGLNLHSISFATNLLQNRWIFRNRVYPISTFLIAPRSIERIRACA